MTIRGKRIPLVYLVILVAGTILAVTLLRPSSDENERKDLSAVISDVQTGQVERIVVSGSTVEVTRKDQTQYDSRLEPDTSIYLVLSRSATPEQVSAVAIEVKAKGTPIWGYIVYLLPILILVGLLIFFMRRMQGGGSQITAFGKSKARRWTGEQSTGRFDDVAGLEESKAELQEVVEFLRTPEKFAALGAKIPRGVLLVGPPGTGKTLMAR